MQNTNPEPQKPEPHPSLELLLNGVPVETEIKQLRERIADCELRHALIDRTMPNHPEGVGDGNTTDILILLELRANSRDALVAEQALTARDAMIVRVTALARIANEERAISIEYSDAFHRLNKIGRLMRGLEA